VVILARPLKPGLIYFPLDVDALSDQKLRAARREYGYLAIVVYLELLCILYRDKGYYIEYNDETRYDIVSTILSDALIGKYQPTPQTIEDVIDRLVACRLFSHDLYQRGFITSKRAQQTYYKSTLDRKFIGIDWSLWLLSESEMRNMSSRSAILAEFVNQSNNGVNPSNNPIIRSDNPTKERIGEKRKVEKSKAEERTGDDIPFPSRYKKIFFDLFGREPNEAHVKAIENLRLGGKLESVILEVLESTGNKYVREPEPYIYRTLQNYTPKHGNLPVVQDDDPDRPLEQWELDWLAEVKAQQRMLRGLDGKE